MFLEFLMDSVFYKRLHFLHSGSLCLFKSSEIYQNIHDINLLILEKVFTILNKKTYENKIKNFMKIE